MEEQSRQNFAHAGCLAGSIVGLSGGIVLAWILLLHAFNLGQAMLVWLALTIALAAIGYVSGSRIVQSPRRPPQA